MSSEKLRKMLLGGVLQKDPFSPFSPLTGDSVTSEGHFYRTSRMFYIPPIENELFCLYP